MNFTHEKSKYGADKIILLALLALSMFIAYLIVEVRSSITFSEPITLEYSGLSVSIPIGNGWYSNEKWRHYGNLFILNSSLSPATRKISAQVLCRYFLSTPAISPDIRFERKANEVNGQITNTGNTTKGSLTFEWAHIEIPRAHSSIVLAIAALPNGRQLEIQVQQLAGEGELVNQVFEKLTEKIQFEDNYLLQSGVDIVSGLKDRGLDRSFRNNQQDFFLIKDSENHNIGFTMDILNNLPDENDLNIRATGLLYLSGINEQEKKEVFQSDNNLEEFTWKSQSLSKAGEKRSEVILDDDGIITTLSYGPMSRQRNYTVGPAAIPHVLLDAVLGQMISSGQKKIIVDVIKADGAITPAFVSADEDAELSQGASYSLKMELLDGSGFHEQVFLNGQEQVIKRISYQHGTFVLERTSLEVILKEFPERTGLIMQENPL